MKSKKLMFYTIIGSTLSFGAQAATISNNADLHTLLSTTDYVGGLVVSPNVISYVVTVDKDIKIRNNNSIGLNSSGGVVNFIGNTENSLSFTEHKAADGLSGRGIYATGANSEIIFTHMNLEVKNNVNGIELKSGAKFTFIGHSLDEAIANKNIIKLNSNQNNGKTDGIGLYMTNAGSKFETHNADIEANENALNGIVAGSGSTFSANGSSNFVNWLKANKNKNFNETVGVGIYGTNSTISINKMNVSASENANAGILLETGVNANIVGHLDGSNRIVTDLNKSSATTTGFGIYVGGNNANLTITNMDVFARNNVNGLVVSEGAKFKLTSSTEKTNWIYATNNKTTSERSGIGIYASGNNALFETLNMNIDASNNVTGIEVSGANDKSTIKLVGNGTNILKANNNIGEEKGRGIFASALSNSETNISTITIQDMDIEAKNNSNSGISAINGTIKIESENRNALYLEGNSSSGLYSGKGKSLIEIKGLDIFSKNNVFARVLSGGSLKIENSNIDLSGEKKSAFIVNNGIANIDLKNVFLSNNKGRLLDVYEQASTDNIVANLKAENSTLEGAIVTENKIALSSIKTNIDFKNVTWKNVGASTLSSYKADNAQLFMNVFYGKSKASDKLTITDSSSGTSVLNVSSIGTDGRQASILLVDQSTVATENAKANFSLNGSVLDGGAFEYALFKGDEYGSNLNANNWYLRSTGSTTNTAKAIINVPTIQISVVKASLNELRKRLGEIRNGDYCKDNGTWVRTFAKSLKVNDNIDSKMNLFGLEAGYDHALYKTKENRIIAGFMTGYSYTDNIKTRNTRSINGKGHANTPTVGLYATWLNKKGWFVDSTLRHFWSNMSMTTYTAQGNSILFEDTRQYTAGTFEFGRQMRWDIDSTSQYILEPKIELSYTHAGAKNFKLKSDSFNGALKYDKSESFQTRLGVMSGYEKRLENGSILQPFVEASVIREFSGITNIDYDAAQYKSDTRGTSYEIGGGLNAQINNSWAAYGDTMYEFGSNIQGISANLGIRYSF